MGESGAALAASTEPIGVRRVLLVAPRGYCAGVERAVEAALARWRPPVYVRRQIVHNVHVVRALQDRGAIFVESEEQAPPGTRIVVSAHGVSPAVHERARVLGLKPVDATCPLVSKVHAEARHYATKAYAIILIGHAGHEEVEGTTGGSRRDPACRIGRGRGVGLAAAVSPPVARGRSRLA